MRIPLILLSILQFILPFQQQNQPGQISFLRTSATIAFPNSITFESAVQDGEGIVEAILIYGVKQDTCGDVTAYAYPEYSQGDYIDLRWVWDMRQSGSLPPGSEVWWQWQVTDTNGQVFSTEKQQVIWLDEEHPWTSKDQGMIRLHSYSLSGDQTVEVLNAADTALTRLSQETGIEPGERIDIYIYDSTESMREAILYEAGWAGGLAFPEFNILLVGISPDQIEWGKQTVAHEITHVLIGDFTFSCLGSIPTWLNEGLAMVGEGGLDAAGESLFRQALGNDSLFPFKVLSGGFSEDPDKANLSYSQSYHMTEYLIRTYGHKKINQLLEVLSTGTNLDQALLDTYGFNLAGFEYDWFTSLGKKPDKSVSDIQTTVTPTPIPTIQPFAIQSVKQPDKPTGGGWSAGKKTILAILVGCLCVIGISVVAFLTFLLANERSKRRRLIPAMALIIGLSFWMVYSISPVLGESSGDQTFPMNPTATPFVSPTARPGEYLNSDAGIRVKYPVQVQVIEGDTGGSLFASFMIGDKEAFGSLFVSSMDPTESLEGTARSIRETSFADIADVNLVEDKQIILKSGQKAWYSLADGVLSEYKQDIRIGMVTVLGSSRAVSLQMYSIPENYDYYLPQIQQMMQSIELIPRVIRGYERDEVLLLDGGESGNPIENDPATTHTSGDTLVFSGLVQTSPGLAVIPDLAAGWDISTDGLVYTFHLQPKARFHNGRPVTAQDVVYSWERAADDATGSDVVMTYLGDILGVNEMHSGQADHIRGLKVMDDFTLQVTIDAPKPYFLQKLTYPTAFIVDQENIAMGREWYLTPNGTGPYKLVRWESMKEKVYERYDQYYGDKPQIPAIVVYLYAGDSTRLYEMGTIDIAGVGSYNVDRFSDPSEPLHDQLHSVVNLCTNYITLDVTQPPFDDLKVRQAFALALDRKMYIDVVMNGAALPATGLYPPALPGYDLNQKGWDYDPERASQLLKESNYPADRMPTIIFTTSGYGSSISPGVAAWVQMWEQNLGVKIQIHNIEPEKYQQIITRGKHGQMISQGWCADYPDPENFASVLFHSDTAMNYGNYNNQELDSLLEKAAVETDTMKRILMYQQAEQIIASDVPAIFVSHGMSYVLVKPFVQGYIHAPMSFPVERYLSINPNLIDP